VADGADPSLGGRGEVENGVEELEGLVQLMADQVEIFSGHGGILGFGVCGDNMNVVEIEIFDNIFIYFA